MNLKYFSGTNELSNLKAEFKKLMLLWHPDKNREIDTTEICKLIILEYDYILKNRSFVNAKNEAETINYEAEILLRETYVNVINMLIKLDNIRIELVGTWLWISGNTFENKEQIKAAGCLFSGSKKLWYYRDGEYKGWNKNPMTFDSIKQKYGSQVIYNDSKELA